MIFSECLLKSGVVAEIDFFLEIADDIIEVNGASTLANKVHTNLVVVNLE